MDNDAGKYPEAEKILFRMLALNLFGQTNSLNTPNGEFSTVYWITTIFTTDKEVIYFILFYNDT